MVSAAAAVRQEHKPSRCKVDVDWRHKNYSLFDRVALMMLNYAFLIGKLW